MQGPVIETIDGQQYIVEVEIINGFKVRGLTPILSEEERMKRAADIKQCFINILNNRTKKAQQEALAKS